MRLLSWVLLASSSSSSSHRELGRTLADEGRALAADGDYTGAVQSWQSALAVARKAIILMPAPVEEDDEDNSQQQRQDDIDWMVDLCCESSRLRLQHLDDPDGARGDAWAACVYTEHQRVAPLECLLEVCRATEDVMGEYQALQQLLTLPPPSGGGTPTRVVEHEVRAAWKQRAHALQRQLEEQFGAK